MLSDTVPETLGLLEYDDETDGDFESLPDGLVVTEDVDVELPVGEEVLVEVDVEESVKLTREVDERLALELKHRLTESVALCVLASVVRGEEDADTDMLDEVDGERDARELWLLEVLA